MRFSTENSTGAVIADSLVFFCRIFISNHNIISLATEFFNAIDPNTYTDIHQ